MKNFLSDKLTMYCVLAGLSKQIAKSGLLGNYFHCTAGNLSWIGFSIWCNKCFIKFPKLQCLDFPKSRVM